MTLHKNTYECIGFALTIGILYNVLCLTSGLSAILRFRERFCHGIFIITYASFFVGNSWKEPQTMSETAIWQKPLDGNDNFKPTGRGFIYLFIYFILKTDG